MICEVRFHASPSGAQAPSAGWEFGLRQLRISFPAHRRLRFAPPGGRSRWFWPPMPPTPGVPSPCPVPAFPARSTARGGAVRLRRPCVPLPQPRRDPIPLQSVELAAGAFRPGAPDSYDGAILYYGTVIRINGTYHLWYNGNYGAERPLLGFELAQCCLCYATSKDGVHWVKPDLGPGGVRRLEVINNLVDFPDQKLWSTCAMLYDPEDPNPDRRYKMAYEARCDGALKFCVVVQPGWLSLASPAGLRDPLPIFLEMSGVTRWGGLYYVTGQANATAHHRTVARRLCSYVSADFEHWSPCSRRRPPTVRRT